MATVLGKIEGRNPAYSVKDRIGASMIWDAEKRAVLGPGKELIEPTSGNTGIALAFVAAARGYPITLVMPDTMSVERRRVLRAFGANLILTEGSGGMQASMKRPNRSLPILNATCCCSNSRIQLIRKSISKLPDRKSGTTPKAPSMSWSAGWERAERLRAFRVTSERPEEEDYFHRGGAGAQRGDHAEAQRRAPETRPA